jgi:hypothetical protein
MSQQHSSSLVSVSIWPLHFARWIRPDEQRRKRVRNTKRRLVIWALLTGALVGMVGWSIASPSGSLPGSSSGNALRFAAVCRDAQVLLVDKAGVLPGETVLQWYDLSGSQPIKQQREQALKAARDTFGEDCAAGGGGHGPSGPTPPPLTG